MRRIISSLAFILVLVALFSLDVPRTAAQAGDPWALIAEVNALRASYGLAPYEVNNTLMSIAQSHSQYQMSIGSVTHSGPGGSRPYDRAVAAGYGIGAQVYVSENIAMGVNLTPKQAVYEMWQDSLHLETMISSRYREIGAGAAVSGSYVYYTIDVGVVAGSAGSGSSPPSSGQNPPAAPLPTIAIIQPVLVATPRADGSVVHVVDDGQAPYHIADAYEVPLLELLALNGLAESSIIHPGDKLVVQPATTQLPAATTTPDEATPTRTPRPTATRTSRPTATPTPTTPVQAALDLASTPQAPDSSGPLGQASLAQARSGPDYLLIAAGVLAFAGLGLIILGGVLKRGG